MALDGRTIGVVGASGAVGREMLRLLAASGHSPSKVTAYASSRSAGTQVHFGDDRLTVVDLETLRTGAVPDVMLLAASSGVAKEWGPALVERGCVVVDNSSAFRMAPGVALVIPEVNGDAIRSDTTPRVIANPNCSTIIMLMGATPLRDAFGCTRLIASTYQAASGAGIDAMDELRAQSRDVLDAKPVSPRVFAEPCAFNVFSHDSEVDPRTGLNVEEAKMIEETRKIWGDDRVEVLPTCVRVPVLRAHCESVLMTTERPASLGGARAALSSFAGVRLVDDRAANDFPTPLKASEGADVLIGRVRVPDERTVQFFVAGDQLLKGAAQNAVQIAELAFEA